jgi:hypothetical protein
MHHYMLAAPQQTAALHDPVKNSESRLQSPDVNKSEKNTILFCKRYIDGNLMYSYLREQ